MPSGTGSPSSLAIAGLSTLGASSPWRGRMSLPWQSMPAALSSFSTSGSTSSTTTSVSTVAAKARIFSSGTGQEKPSFSTGASGKDSRTCIQAGPEATKPTRRSPPLSMMLSGEASASARSTLSRSNISGMRLPAPAGVITQRADSFLKPAATWATRSPTVTRPLTWLMRVVMRRITGTWNFSEKSKAELGHLVGFLRIGRLEHRHMREAAPVARILLVLRRGQADVVGDGDDQAADHAGQRQRHQRVGGDVHADVLHGAEGARTGEGGADGDFQRHLLVHRPFGVDVRVGRNDFQHFGGRRAGIGGGDAATGFPDGAGNGFVAGKQKPGIGSARA